MSLVIRHPVTGNHGEVSSFTVKNDGFFWEIFIVWLVLMTSRPQVEGQEGLHSVGLDPPRQVGGIGLVLGHQASGDWKSRGA